MSFVSALSRCLLAAFSYKLPQLVCGQATCNLPPEMQTTITPHCRSLNRNISRCDEVLGYGLTPWHLAHASVLGRGHSSEAFGCPTRTAALLGKLIDAFPQRWTILGQDGWYSYEYLQEMNIFTEFHVVSMQITHHMHPSF